MNRKRLLYKIACCLTICCLINTSLFAQVKIGGIPSSVNPDAVLELESTNKGLLLPRLGLMATNNPYPLSAFVEGMFVYDTATINDITPGLYYCDGTKWIRINGAASITPSPSGGWSLTGNTGTTPGVNFIGTTDGNDLVFKTNNVERLRLTKYGWIGLGTSTPQAALHVKGQIKVDSLQSGNLGTDSVLVADGSGRVKSVNSALFLTGVKKTSYLIVQNGQLGFSAPAAITDPERILLYRNGVMINFTVSSSNLIIPEIVCVPGDELKIVQFL